MEAPIGHTGHSTAQTTLIARYRSVTQDIAKYSLDGCSVGSERLQGCGDRRGHRQCRSLLPRPGRRDRRTFEGSVDRTPRYGRHTYCHPPVFCLSVTRSKMKMQRRKRWKNPGQGGARGTHNSAMQRWLGPYAPGSEPCCDSV